MSERDEAETSSWEDNFREEIHSFSGKSGRKARSLTERDDIIYAMEAKRLILQYGNDLRIRMHALSPGVVEREALFESMCLALTGAFIAGKFEGRKVEQPSESAFVADILKIERKNGPYPSERDNISRRMLQDLQNGEDLVSMKQEALAERYGASRGTSVAARETALSMFAEGNSDRTPPDTDKV